MREAFEQDTEEPGGIHASSNQLPNLMPVDIHGHGVTPKRPIQ